MIKTKETLVIAFALFSLFFGAGNLILPPLLGFKSGDFWWLVTLGFCVSAVLIPILGILAHAKLQGTMFDFGKKVSPTFALVYSFIVYAISIALPSPRTASVTHEIAIQPFFESSSLVTSFIYFGLVYLFVINRSKILNVIGKILTPAIISILLLIIGVATFSFDFDFGEIIFTKPFTDGILEGYQTFDAIGAVVVGGVIIISINLRKKNASYAEKKSLIRRAGWLAGLGLFLIYAGLIFTGALMHNEFDADISRTALLNGISIKTLGNTANLFLSILVSLACFTTAVGIVTGTADFMKYKFGDSQLAYTITAIVGCVLGVVMGQFDVHYIIAVAVPALMFIYPITIILILLNVMPEKYTSPLVFKAVVVTTILFSIPDFLGSIGFENSIASIKELIPLGTFSMGWVLPSLLVMLLVNALRK
ncbi:branched-chain amino acid transport system II carrier protein [Maribacter sp. HTCC2170]|uniref:branched-chain amino acid transport system II carrier protein n=1 Tax=Maribacter sp. (strain HTCC2170 / KCCM 42371) TaxID=313603 RepID=UPI00006BD3BE|nr:branched-chain amino acid transport system II carrier protein [Maribacter sp. HTCC2170]EAR02681.1 branched-chain amino acid transport system carrier protein [Maribacter sp. HTCC2170]